MPPGLSVLICTYNPKKRFLRRTLEGLARQSLARERWELLLIDNHSSLPVRDRYDLSWHPSGQHLFADTLGKTHAIAEGVRAARGDVLIVVDDDNLLNDDYLEEAERIFQDYPFMGVVGGMIDGEYESPPPEWANPYLPFLAVENRGGQVRYAFTPDSQLVCPGAGMVIRKRVVEHYLRVIADDPVRKGMDPVGDRLSRAGDIDMMLCAYDVGLAKGYFPSLRLTHLIPPERLRLDYLVRLRDEGEYCGVLLLLIRGLPVSAAGWPWLTGGLRTLRAFFHARRVFWQWFRLEWAAARGRQRAFREFSTLRAPTEQTPRRPARAGAR